MGVNTALEKRRSPRLPASWHAELIVDSGGKRTRQTVRVINTSLLGAGIRSVGTLMREQLVVLVPSDRSPNTYSCRVAWVKQLSSQFYSDAGLEFRSVAR
jgi:hypothetical protein